MSEQSKRNELQSAEIGKPLDQVEPSDLQAKEGTRESDKSDHGAADSGPNLELSASSASIGSEPVDGENDHKSLLQPGAGGEPNPPTGFAQTEFKPPLDRLLVSQIASSVPDWLSNPEAVDGAVQLYLNFKPTDATEDVLARLAVGLTNATLDGLERASRTALNPQVRQTELKLSHKGSAAVVDVLKMLETHRRSDNQKIRVGSVNVGSGGQAIVGNVHAAPRDDQDPEK